MKKIPQQIQWKILLAVFKARRLTQKLLGTRALDYSSKKLRIYTSTIREYYTRARSCHKEPETCAWLQSVAVPGRVLYDIGANVGAYSLVAASEGMTVYAFEPSPENYAALSKNIVLNALEKKVAGIPFALSAKGGLFANSSPDDSSGATHTFTASSENVGLQTPFMPLDMCVSEFSLPKPYAIKIDVDGAELDVLNGARTVLASPELREMFIEVDESLQVAVESLLVSCGFSKMHSFVRGRGVHNVHFVRV